MRWLVAAPSIAAGFAAIAFVSIAFLDSAPGPVAYVTAKGDREEVTLADGSVVSLNTDTEISVSIGKDARRVTLKRGEALFDVVRDIERPFSVTSATTRVEVLGTRFNVRESGPGAVVSVLSGVVEVAAAQAPGGLSEGPAATLIAGQQAVFQEGDAEPAVVDFSPDLVVSWRKGTAFYENELLSDVVRDLNRYYPTPIAISDPRLNSMRVTGGFDLTDQAVAIEALTVALALRADHSAPNLITLYADE